MKARQDDGGAIVVTYSASKSLFENMVEKGPVCVDGVSLTLIQKKDEDFSVSLVKFTQNNTTVLDKEIGDLVNVETDILMRYVVQALEARGRTAADPSKH